MASLKVIPTATITFNDMEVKVDLKNWESISAAKLELVYHALVKATYVARAQGMQRHRVEEAKAAAAAQLVKETTSVSA
jgi:hypothetical protein